SAGATDGQRDFDFWKGTWKGHSKRLVKPLTGSKEWIEFDATNVTTMIMGGRGFMDEYQSNRPRSGPGTHAGTIRSQGQAMEPLLVEPCQRPDGLTGDRAIQERKG